MNDDLKTEDPRAVPSDQRSEGPDHTVILTPAEAGSRIGAAAAGQPVRLDGTPRLVGRSEAVADQVFELTKQKTMIGRQDSNDIVIADSTVSARHAQIVNDDGIWRVVNLISTNGTAVNGRANVVSFLVPGDVIAFGNVEMLFDAPDSARTVPGAVGSMARKRQGTRRTMTRVGVGVVVLVLLLGVARLLGLL